ncbi:MAG TPA: response regulator [Candidatus Merdivicinus excrementipullorum]|uniref:Stage 0 sporulation protein A homolog n=1 Tax=Candidatus Merdivicinus excrementipullorum TaxID=2840867 RepID=A0A9D1FPZ4_9FIRM|nr:response regulator [Candidatus Merdivicinus excrementipullorum]
MSKILIVDDQNIVRCGIAKMLEDLDLGIDEIYEAANGAEALDVIQAQNPAVILLDIMMPVQDGFHLLEKLQELSIHPYVVIITSHSNFSYAQKAVRFHVDAYLTKPIQQEELEQILIDIFTKIEREEETKEHFELYRKRVYDYRLLEFLRGNNVLSDGESLCRETGIAELQGDRMLFMVTSSLENAACHPLYSRIFRELFGPNWKMFESPGSELLLLAGLSGSQQEKISEDLAVLLQSSGIQQKCGVSFSPNQFAKFSDAYFQAKISLAAAMEKDCVVYFYQEAKRQVAILISCKDCDSFLKIFHTEDRSHTMAYFDNLFSRLFSSGMKIEHIKLALQSFVNYVNMNLQERYQTSFSDKDLKDCIEIRNNLMEIKLQMKKFYATLYEQWRENGLLAGEDTSHLIQKVLAYLQTHYAENPSLSLLSEQYHLSYTYLSSLFSKQVGQSFTDYLMQVKLEHAKEILRDTNIKITDVSAQTGFSNPAYFCKMFKKYYQVSPAEYRNLH